MREGRELMSKLSNALRMIELLHARGKMKIRDLAEELEVKERMVRIYRDDLEKAGIFIESEPGRDGGYCISNAAFFPVRNLSKEEMEALTFAIDQLSSKGGVYVNEAKLALDKLRAVRKTEEHKERHIYFAQSSRPNYENLEERERYLQLQKAFNQKKRVIIAYEGVTGKQTSRIIEPYGFVHYNEFFYCVARCLAKKELRLFKIVRIKGLDIKNEHYLIPDGFDVRKEFPKFGVMKEPFTVKLHIYPPFSSFVSESVWGESQTIQCNQDGSIIFQATMNGKGTTKKWILGMGAHIQVLEPPSLREEIIKENEKLLELYASRSYGNK